MKMRLALSKKRKLLSYNEECSKIIIYICRKDAQSSTDSNSSSEENNLIVIKK